MGGRGKWREGEKMKEKGKGEGKVEGRREDLAFLPGRVAQEGKYYRHDADSSSH